MDVFLVYCDDVFVEWIEMVYERVLWKFKCIFIFFKILEYEGCYYECDVFFFMEIGLVVYKFYFLNIWLFVNEKKKINVGIGEIKDIWLVGIY